MKEVTEWDNKPRWMWVWDNDERCKHKEYVIYILTAKEAEEFDALPVTTPTNCYKHCVEIEEPKKRPCTREELLEMLKKQGFFVLKSSLTGNYFMVLKISDSHCTVYDGGEYTYNLLCEQFTLLDGTELWIKE